MPSATPNCVTQRYASMRATTLACCSSPHRNTAEAARAAVVADTPAVAEPRAAVPAVAQLVEEERAAPVAGPRVEARAAEKVAPAAAPLRADTAAVAFHRTIRTSTIIKIR